MKGELSLECRIHGETFTFCVFTFLSQPPMCSTQDAPLSRATSEGSTIPVAASVPPFQGKWGFPQTRTSPDSLLGPAHFFFFFLFIFREPNKTLVLSFFQTDLGGLLPRSVVDSFFPSSMTSFYSNLSKTVRSLRDLWDHEIYLHNSHSLFQTRFYLIYQTIIVPFMYLEAIQSLILIVKH